MKGQIADTPEPPYYAVIFTSIRTEEDAGYEAMAQKMAELASRQPGFLGMESARGDIGLTVCYWTGPKSIQNWKADVEHAAAQRLGKERWYADFRSRICRVESVGGK
jgi:heme-degrading monooxygenase HmoA